MKAEHEDLTTDDVITMEAWFIHEDLRFVKLRELAPVPFARA
jgi:hypothetical protein